MKAKRLRSFVLYSDDDRVIPMSLLRRTHPPRGKGLRWLEIPRGCCTLTPFTPILGRGKKRLRAFVKISKSGDTMSGPVIRKNPPKDPFFKEIPYDLCCQQFLQAIVISSQPEDVTGQIGENVSFSVGLSSGNGTITYTWFVDGVEVEDNNSPTLNIDGVSMDDDGTEVYVVIENEMGTVTSDTATLTVSE